MADYAAMIEEAPTLALVEGRSGEEMIKDPAPGKLLEDMFIKCEHLWPNQKMG